MGVQGRETYRGGAQADDGGSGSDLVRGEGAGGQDGGGVEGAFELHDDRVKEW